MTAILIPLETAPGLQSVSGLQAKELMGLTVKSIEDLTDSDAADFNEFYEELYMRAWRSLEMDATKIMSGFYQYPDGVRIQGKFNFNRKWDALVSSMFQETVLTGTLFSVLLRPALSLYSGVSVNWIEFNIQAIPSPDPTCTIKVIDLYSGVTLYTQEDVEYVEGNNRIQVLFTIPPTYDQVRVQVEFSDDVDVLNTVFPIYGSWQYLPDNTCRCGYGGGWMFIQLENPGINVSITGFCSVERFMEHNFPIFKFALYYGIGREFMKERVASDRVNEYTMLNVDRAANLLAAYEKDYMSALDTLRDINNMVEDTNCFTCNRPLKVGNLLP